MKSRILAGAIVLVALFAVVLGSCSKKEAPQAAPAASAAPAPAAVKYPTGPIQIVVPYRAGGGVDKAARIIAAPLEKELGVPIVIVNKPEGNGTVAISELSKQEPDGINLMVVSNRDLFGHIVNKTEGVDYRKDSFSYIATVLEAGDVLYTKKGGMFDSFEKLVTEAKKNPGKVTVSIANNTGLATVNALGKKLGISLTGIVYGSGNEAFKDLLGGHVNLSLVASSFSVQAEDQGFGGIAIFADNRMPSMPDVPTVGELGADGVVSPMLRLLIGPKDLPQGVMDTLYTALDKIYAPDSEVVKTITKQGDSPTYLKNKPLMDFVDQNFAMREREAASK